LAAHRRTFLGIDGGCARLFHFFQWADFARPLRGCLPSRCSVSLVVSAARDLSLSVALMKRGYGHVGIMMPVNVHCDETVYVPPAVKNSTVNADIRATPPICPVALQLSGRTATKVGRFALCEKINLFHSRLQAAHLRRMTRN